jgi:hypothetical protein
VATNKAYLEKDRRVTTGGRPEFDAAAANDGRDASRIGDAARAGGRLISRSTSWFPGLSPDAVERAFGIECTFGTIEKRYAVEAARRYSP